MLAAQERKYVLFDDVTVKWIWNDWELIKFREMWKEGVGIFDLAKEFKCNKRSIALLVMDQAERGFIRQRNKGLF